VDALEQAVGQASASADPFPPTFAGHVHSACEITVPEGHSLTPTETSPATPKQRRIRSR
jgi:hypothetical protein